MPEPLKLIEDCRYLGGGPIGLPDGESADCGLPSLRGEPSHSVGVISADGLAGIPFPNLNAGHSFLAGVRVSAEEVEPLLRMSDGLKSECLRLLSSELDSYTC